MRGSYGAVFIIFGLLVWLARWAGIGAFRNMDPRVLQAIALLMLFGAALILVRLVITLWEVLKEEAAKE